MNKMLACGALAVVSLLAPAIAQARVEPEAEANAVSRSVTGTFEGGTFRGHFRLGGYAFRAGALLGMGTLTGELIDPNGYVLAAIQQEVEFPVVGAAATCTIVRVELGSLDLTVGGISLHLEGLTLELPVRRGSLLGLLLCSLI
jgi:hypothetical protein